MSYTDTIEKAKELVRQPSWPRSINDFPTDSSVNCWGFALDGMKIPSLQELSWYSNLDTLDTEIFAFLNDIGLNPRKISTASEKAPSEMVFLFYIFSYFDVNVEDFRSECHVARIEYDGTVVEKAGPDAEPVVTSLEEIQQRLLNQDKVLVNPISFAVQKPC